MEPGALGRRRRRGGAFSIARLFANGEAGGVYDPSDLTAEKVAWRRNLLTWSEDFTNAAWSKTGSGVAAAPVITGNAGVAPDGTMTADRVQFDCINTGSSSNRSLLQQAVTLVVGLTYTRTIRIKAWDAGNIGKTLRVATDGIIGSTVATLTADWQEVTLTGVAAATSGSLIIECRGTITTQTADILLWGTQLEVSPTATAYQRITDFTSDFLAAFPTHGLYQDAAGTTPVTALGQPVGLVIDSKTGGLANVGPELVTNGDFPVNTTGWTAGNSPVLTVGANGVTIQNNGASAGYLYQAMTTVIGRSYLITGSIVYGGTGFARIEVSTTITNPGGGNINASASGSYRWVFTATAATTYIIIGNRNDTNAAHTYDNISVREVPGVHAIQPTNSSRPLLDGRVNLLTFSEQFDNAVWTKADTTVTANATTAPNGTTTADSLLETATTAAHAIYQAASVTSGASYQWTGYVRANGRTRIRLVCAATSAVLTADYNISAITATVAAGSGTVSIESIGSGWFRLFATATATATGTGYWQANLLDDNGNLSYLGDVTKGMFIWGADLRLAADAAYPYQRVAAATDYADVGVPRSFAFDGFDDSLYTASNMDLSGTDKVTVLAGVRKLSEAAVGALTELSANAGSNNGSFVVYAPTSPLGTIGYEFGARGTINRDAQASGFLSPNTSVLTGLADIVADATVLRVNGVVRDTDTGDLGTGNYGSYVLFIGRRNNASLPFNGKAYQLIVRGALTDAATLAQAERYVGAKTGLYL